MKAKDRWIAKFATNGARMERNFKRGNQKCGFFDPSIEHGGPQPSDRYDREDPTKGIRPGFLIFIIYLFI